MNRLKLQWHIDRQVFEWVLDASDVIIIGRQDDCDVVLPDERISRRHVEITVLSDNKTVLRNLSSTNDVYFKQPDGLSPLGKDEELTLKAGFIFQLGAIELHVFEDDDKPKLVCSNCERIVSTEYIDCPWCGTNLAFAKSTKV